MIPWLIAVMILHPGHMTRLEIRVSDDAKHLEVAMRIQSADLESALKRQLNKPVDVQTMLDHDAKQLIGHYLRQTLSLDGEKLSDDDYRWVGWQRQPREVWIYFELPVLTGQAQTVKLRIGSLFEVESELRHVVVLDSNAGDRSVIITNPDTPVVIQLGGAQPSPRTGSVPTEK